MFNMVWGRPSSWCAGRAATRRATRESRWTTSLTVRRPLPHSSGLRAALCHAPPRRRRLSPSPCLSPRQALPLMPLRRRVISARSSTLFYWWPADGWQRGTVARLCPRGAFSHVVAYTRQTSALRGTADTLLDAASYGHRWVLLSPAPAAGVDRAAASSPIARRTRRQGPRP